MLCCNPALAAEPDAPARENHPSLARRAQEFVRQHSGFQQSNFTTKVTKVTQRRHKGRTVLGLPFVSSLCDLCVLGGEVLRSLPPCRRPIASARNSTSTTARPGPGPRPARV